MADVTSSFNEIKIDGDNNKVYIGSNEKFEPSLEWFNNQNNLAIKDLGARYTPEINIELNSLLENFDALSRNDSFQKRVDKAYHDFIVLYRKYVSHLYSQNEELQNLNRLLNDNLQNLETIYDSINFQGIKEIDYPTIIEIMKEIESLSYKISEFLYKLNSQEIEDKNITTTHGHRTATEYDSNIRDFGSYLSSLHEFNIIFNSKALMLANNPYMILDGDAGIGKSHLLADIVTKRKEEGFYSIFLLGQHFRSEVAPWSQILNDLLRLDCNEEEFLGALNAKAESEQNRIIIFIDAINEGKGRNFWNEFLTSFIASIKQYEWLGLVLSIRSSYFDLIVPSEILENNELIPIRHFGFEGVEYNASKLFFKNYNIVQPSIPLLHPEFSNPLFLKLFCEGLTKKGLTIIPDGYEGITNIIKFFIEGIESKLIKKYRNIKSLKLIDKIIKMLIKERLEVQTIPYDEAYGMVEEIVSKFRLETGLLDDLISEGLLTKNIFYEDKEPLEGIYFAYERFEDHLKAKFLLDNYLDKNNPRTSFEEEPLKNYFEKHERYFYKGIIDAISIQLPELCNVELIDMVKQDEVVIQSYFDSFQWRKATSITANVTKRFFKNMTHEHFQEEIYNVLFSATSNPKHPLNANFLYDYLSQFSMRDRDVFFITLTNSIYLNYEVNPIQRLIDWAWSDEDKSYISDESLLLTSMTLSWFLTSSNRKLRDYSTKAIISILQDRVLVLLELLKKFKNIDEPYIYERLFAIAYGVVVRIENEDGLKELGEYIYETIFNVDEVYPHILLRDYAKNTIEYIDYLGIELNIDIEKIKPPYTSYFPKIEELPRNEELEKYQDRDKGYHQSRIISSMMTEYGNGNGKGYGGYGDFGRYVFGSALYNFECKKYEQLISNYATKKIFKEYGYDGDLFSKVEKNLSNLNYNMNRYNHKIERIGKKYQWIAMYDTLARITDNFRMYDISSWQKKEEAEYQGTFEPYIRNIDPTILLKEIQGDRDSSENFYWSPQITFDWNMTNESWLKSTNDLPLAKTNIEFLDDKNQSWIALTSFPSWNEPIKKGFDRYSTVHKHLWYELRSYLISKSDLSSFIKWANRQNFYGRWMVEEKGQYEMFSREHYWSETYKFFQKPYYERYGDWTDIERDYGYESYPNKIALTTDKYYWESGFDYSKEDSLTMLKPSRIVFDGLNMQYSKRDGEYIDKDKNIICFEASIYNKSHQCLLVKKNEFYKFLEENELTIFWTTIGEKNIFIPNMNYENYLGRMEISSFAYLKDEKLIQKDIQLMCMDKNREKHLLKINSEDIKS